jgi:hypothetical protein
MAGTRARVTRRLGVVVATALMVGGACTGLAFASDGTGGGTSSPSSSSSSSSGSSSGTGSSQVRTLDSIDPSANSSSNDVVTDPSDSSSSSTTTSSTCTSLPILGCITSILPTTSSTTTSSGGGIETIYAPPQYYGGYAPGAYGHRYYGRYWDHGCGCDRYASSSYSPQTVTVTATQVATVPKGGVDTGDGSFR